MTTEAGKLVFRFPDGTTGPGRWDPAVGEIVPVVSLCDYCAEGLPRHSVQGGPWWHERVDPEGIEGVQRMPCVRGQG